ncbi:SDR family oxidoreductase [Candidatus Sumerlaeota bacterium]|nr:SDR family oxidoreductase [Candidatus Sumerlaeota bacterium]
MTASRAIPQSPSGREVLAGRTALVTGGAKRLGRALCEALGAEGVHVVVHYGRSQGPAESLASSLRDRGARAWTVQTDLAKPDAGATLFAEAVHVAGPIDILVNNAAVFPRDILTEVPPEDFLKTLQVNAFAPLALSRAFAAQEREGSILNLLDARIADYDRVHASYHASKRLLFSLTRMLALEFAPRIRVNAVAPGLILPPVGETDAYLDKMKHTNPLQSHGSAQDVIDAALYLLRSRFVTGQVLFVDGGRHMKGSVYGC